MVENVRGVTNNITICQLLAVLGFQIWYQWKLSHSTLTQYSDIQF